MVRTVSNPNIKNRGIGWETAEGVLDRIGYISKGHPTKIFIMVGINDIINYDMELEKIVHDYRNIINTIKNNSPETQIYVLSVLPLDENRRGHQSKNRKVFSLNSRLKSFINGRDVLFVDLSPLLTDENSNLDLKYSYDGVHLNSMGYLVIKDALNDYMN